MQLAKLDSYDSEVLPGVIKISLVNTNDPDLVDILSEIENSGGKIYVDGCYYWYSNKYEIITEHGETYLELHVVEAA